MALTNDQRAALVAELRDDPTGRGYLGFATDDPAWNVFNVLRDPAWGVTGEPPEEGAPAPFTQGLAVLGIPEAALTIDDVRAALAEARE